MEPDHDLERLFRDMRAADERSVPAFSKVIAPRAAAPRTMRLRVAALAAAAMVFAGLVWWWRVAPNERALVIAFTPGEMRVPTDYLLDMATFTRAGEIPRIGAAEWFPVPLPDAGSDNRRSP